jgi:membrane protease YdiL (CAAX protease family)
MTVPQALYSSAAVTLLIVGTILWIRALIGGGAQRWLDASPRLPAWTIGWGDFLLLPFFALILLIFLLQGAAWIVGVEPNTQPSAEALLAGSYAIGIALTGAAVLFRLLPTGHPGEAREGALRSVRTGLMGLVYFMPVGTVLALGWTALLRALDLPVDVQDAVRIIRETKSPVMLVQWFFVVVILAPIGEELIFRAGIFRFLANRMRPALAAVISAALFAAMHPNLPALLPLFALGLALAHVYHRSGRIIAAIVLHAAFNLNTLLSILSGAVTS